MKLRDSILAARRGPLASQADGTSKIEFQFSSEAPMFAGHFPGQPLLPGIVQVEMVRMAAEWVLDSYLKVREIAKAKFLRPIAPAEILLLELKLSNEDDLIKAHGRFSVCRQPAGDVVLLLFRNE